MSISSRCFIVKRRGRCYDEGEVKIMAKKMKLTALCSVLATLVLTVLYQYVKSGLLYSLAITAGTLAYHFVMRLIVGAVVDAVMHNRADYRKLWYQLRPFEERLYNKLGVKHWKSKLPTYDPSLFSVKERSFDEIAQATCQAEIVHEVIALFSLLPIFAAIWFGSFWVFLLTSIAAACVDLTFAILQRYNRPRLVKMAERMRK